MRVMTLLLLVSSACTSTRPVAPRWPALPSAPVQTDPLEQLRVDAHALEPLAHTALGRAFLAGAAVLPPPVQPASWRVNPRGRWLSQRQFELLPAAEQEGWRVAQPVEVTEYFYNTSYGSPLAYVRAIDLLGAQGLEPGTTARIIDFGFGGIGSLRLEATLGWSAVGVDVTPLLDDLYGPVEQGAFSGGSVEVLVGHFPSDERIVGAVRSARADVFLAKNVLKRGYVHPERPVARPEWLLSLGVSDDEFLRAVHDTLKPHGLFLIYNVCPALTPPDKPFIPWSDGRSPYTREQFEQAGFRIKAFDVDDSDFVRVMGHVLRWDASDDPDHMNLEHDLSVLYTLVERAD